MTPTPTEVKRRIRILLRTAIRHQAYWLPADAWTQLQADAEAADVLLPTLLQEMGLRIADTAPTGEVHLG